MRIICFGISRCTSQFVRTFISKFSMANACAVGYHVVTSEETVKRIANYKVDLINGKAVAGKYLRERISKLDLSKISLYDFLELLLSTKKPQIFAERDVNCNGKDWNSREFALLGDINVAVKVLAYDNGEWDERRCSKYDKPLDVELLFTPGTMLNTNSTGVENNPDYTEVVKNGNIMQGSYNALVKRRLLPLLSYVNNDSENKSKALVVVPGIGCGFFAGNFRGQMENRLAEALQDIIEKHKFPNIKGIQLGFYSQRHKRKKEINGVIYEVRGHGLPQLSHPQEYGEEFKECKLYKIVAWDHVSLPGNDFFSNNTRYTDDGVSAAATNVMEVITGVKGMYMRGKYLPPKGYNDWKAVAKAKNVYLVANKDNIKVVTIDGQYSEDYI